MKDYFRDWVNGKVLTEEEIKKAKENSERTRRRIFR